MVVVQSKVNGFRCWAQKSKSVAKRKREESADASTDADAKRLRQEMRQRGHVTVAKRGEDPLQVGSKPEALSPKL